jgi:uncharacterized protein YuzE
LAGAIDCATAADFGRRVGVAQVPALSAGPAESTMKASVRTLMPGTGQPAQSSGELLSEAATRAMMRAERGLPDETRKKPELPSFFSPWKANGTKTVRRSATRCVIRRFALTGVGVRDHESMKVDYDASADAAYIHLIPEIAAGSVEKTVPVDPREIDGMINLDSDSDGRMVGIEVLDASQLLSPETLRSAKPS